MAAARAAVMGAKAVPQTDSAPILEERPLTDRELAEDMEKLLSGFTRKAVAHAAGRSKEAAKDWQEARCAPNAASLLNLARRLPPVRAYVLEKIGAEEAEFDDGRVLAARVEAIERLLAGGGAEGSAVIRILSGQSEAEAQANREKFAVCDLFEQKRRGRGTYEHQ